MNYGDDLFVDTIARRGNDLWPDARVRTFAPLSSQLYAQDGPVGRVYRLGTAALGLVWADTIAMCGGSILQDVGGVDRVRATFLSRKNVEALGVSLGPFFNEEAERRVRELLPKIDHLIVRDQASVQRWLDLNTQGAYPVVGGDIVSLNPTIKALPGAQGPVTICPSAASRLDFQTLRQQVLDALGSVEKLTHHRPAVRLLALSATPSADDLPICCDLATFLRDQEFDVKVMSLAEDGLDALTTALADSSMVLSQRLHGAIVAYLSETPFLVVGHHAKCVDFAADIGLDQRCVVDVRDSWTQGVEAILTSPNLTSMSPQSYRQRAENVYAATADSE